MEEPIAAVNMAEERKEEYVENYDVRVETLEVGYVIQVGCKRFAISSTETLVAMLTKYFNNPGKLQRKYRENKLEIKP